MDQRRYTDHERDTALQVWAFLADRSPTKTARVLQESYGITIPIPTLRYWAENHDWNAQAMKLMHETAPAMVERARFLLVAAIEPAARYYLDALTMKPDGSPVLASVDKERSAIARSVLEGTGLLSPRGKRDSGDDSLPTGARSALPDEGLSSVDEAELRAIVAGHLDVHRDE